MASLPPFVARPNKDFYTVGISGVLPVFSNTMYACNADTLILVLNGNILNITVGDRTPSGDAFYVQAPGSNDAALVAYNWYEVLERLVKEPPYASSSAD